MGKKSAEGERTADEFSGTDWAWRQLALERRRLAELQSQLSQLHKSTSWRITAPMRKLVGLLRRGGKPKLGLDGEMTAARRVPNGIPGELLRADLDQPVGERSGRLIDCVPFLRGLVGEPLLQSMQAPNGSSARWSFSEKRDVPAVGFIGDEELGRELAYSASVDRLAPGNALEWLERNRIDFLLVSPAFHVAEWEWASSFRYDREPGETLAKVLDYCCETAIPIVFWLRIAVDDYPRVSRLIATASKVYACNAKLREIIAPYCKNDEPGILHASVEVALHNPLTTTSLRELKAGLAGACLVDAMQDRIETPDSVVAGRIPAGNKLIFTETYWSIPVEVLDSLTVESDFWGTARSMDKLVLGKLISSELVVSSMLRPNWWNGLQVKRAESQQVILFGEDEPALSPEGGMVGQIREAISRHVTARQRWLSDDTSERLAVILRDVNPASSRELSGRTWPSAACFLVSKRPQNIGRAIQGFLSQKYPNKHLILVLHGHSRGDIPSECMPGPGITLLEAPAHFSLGDCLNMAFDNSGADYWFKLDDDDFYGSEYLSDMMVYAGKVPFDLIGKPLAFSYFQSDGSLYVDPAMYEAANMIHVEDWKPGFVCGATLGGRRDALERVRFPNGIRSGVDSEFMRECESQGMRLLVTDPFNFVCFRSSDPSVHTWVGNEAEVRARGVRIGGPDDIAWLVDV